MVVLYDGGTCHTFICYTLTHLLAEKIQVYFWRTGVSICGLVKKSLNQSADWLRISVISCPARKLPYGLFMFFWNQISEMAHGIIPKPRPLQATSCEGVCVFRFLRDKKWSWPSGTHKNWGSLQATSLPGGMSFQDLKKTHCGSREKQKYGNMVGL